MRKPQAIVLTISDSASRGERTDLSGPAAREELERLGCEVVSVTVVPDDQIRFGKSCWSIQIRVPSISSSRPAAPGLLREMSRPRQRKT